MTQEETPTGAVGSGPAVRSRSELAQRVIVALIAIPLVAIAAYVGGPVLTAALALFAAGGALEFARIAEATGARPFRVEAAVTSAAIVVVAGAHPDPVDAAPGWMLLMLTLTLWTLGAAIWKRGPGGRPLSSVGATVFAALLCGLPLAHAVFLRHLLPDGVEDWMRVAASTGPSRDVFDEAMAFGADLSPWTGVAILAFPLLITWINDSAAYFAGRAWGKRKLIPSVSPGKTVTGAVAGTVASVVAGIALGGWLLGGVLGLPIGWLGGAVCGALVSAAAQVGDLAESLLKREAAVKDSGTFFPGHGGILDRLDALLFAFPVGYWALLVALVPRYFTP